MERHYRTPLNRRTTYRWYDEAGNLTFELDPRLEESTEITIEEWQKWVTTLHRLDDAEVKRNNKMRKLDPFSQKLFDEQRERDIEEFRKRFGRDPRWDELPARGHKQFISIDASLDADGEEVNTDGDHSEIAMQMATDPFREEDTLLEAVRAFIESDAFTAKERTVYYCKEQGMTDEETGKKIGTSGQYAGRVWKKIKGKIEKNTKIQKFIRF